MGCLTSKLIVTIFTWLKYFAKKRASLLRFADISCRAFFHKRPRWPVIISFAVPHIYFHSFA